MADAFTETMRLRDAMLLRYRRPFCVCDMTLTPMPVEGGGVALLKTPFIVAFGWDVKKMDPALTQENAGGRRAFLRPSEETGLVPFWRAQDESRILRIFDALVKNQMAHPSATHIYLTATGRWISFGSRTDTVVIDPVTGDGYALKTSLRDEPVRTQGLPNILQMRRASQHYRQSKIK